MSQFYQKGTLAVLRVAIIAVGLLLLSAVPSIAQLDVTDISIAHGTVGVANGADLSITFNKPLASIEDLELQLFDILESLNDEAVDFTGLGILPRQDDECAAPPAAALVALIPGFCAEDASISADRKTVTYTNMELADNARHTIVVFQAVAEDGSLMEAPVVSVFSTAATLPQGSIGGTISAPLAKTTIDPAGTLVVLLSVQIVENIGADEGDAEPTDDLFLAIADAGGAYSVDFIPDGRYFVVATDPMDSIEGLDDVNSEIKDIPFAGFDADADRILNTVSVESEANVDNIDIALATGGGTTAGDLLVPLQSAVEALSPGAGLVLAAGLGMDATGDAPVWAYMFSPPLAKSTLASPYIAITLGDQAFPPIEVPEDEDLGIPPVADGWVDSDAAIDFIKDAGGDSFFALYPDAIGASLIMDRSTYELVNGLLLGGGLEVSAAAKAIVGARGSSRRFLDAVNALTDVDWAARKTDLVGSVWIAAFAAASDESVMIAVVDGTTGEKILLVSHGSAHMNLAAANTVAAAWAADAALVSVKTEDPQVNPAGEAMTWAFTYYSAALDSAQAFLVSHGDAIRVLGFPMAAGVEVADLVSNAPLADGWIDSDAAFAVVRSHRPDYRSLMSEPTLTVELSNGWDAANPTKPAWHFTLEGLGEDGEPITKEFSVDAQNSTFVSSEGERVLPSRFTLHQNYPNPFNPTTVIRFELDAPANATLTVHDVLGREVARLVQGLQERGAHEARWQPNAAGEAAGVYIYRLTVGDHTASRQMVYLP